MHTVKLSDKARADFKEIQIYLAEYSADVARKHIIRLANTIELIGVEPLIWAPFFLTGAPYRAKLFFVGRSTFWIVYEVDQKESAVNILRVWNSKQNPDDFEL
jgi:plasmid stabilization system protein ParE